MSLYNVRHVTETSLLGSTQQLGLIGKMGQTNVLASTAWELMPRVSIHVKGREKGVRTMDRASSRCYHDGIRYWHDRVCTKGIPMVRRGSVGSVVDQHVAVNASGIQFVCNQKVWATSRVYIYERYDLDTVVKVDTNRMLGVN